MNKIPVVGLIVGFITVSSLFFLMGFFVAVVTFDRGTPSSSSTWAELNNPATKTASVVGEFATKIGGKLLHDQLIHVEARIGGGALSKLTNKIPVPLQPFAVQAQNQLTLKARQQINTTVDRVTTGIFSPSSFDTAYNHSDGPLPTNSRNDVPRPARPQERYERAYSPFAPRPPISGPSPSAAPPLVLRSTNPQGKAIILRPYPLSPAR